MLAQLIDIGNSKGIRIPKKLIQQYGLEDEIEITATSNGLLISKKGHGRDGWDEQIKEALEVGNKPETDLFDGISNEWDKNGWTWPE